jgi:hypothetical protein
MKKIWKHIKPMFNWPLLGLIAIAVVAGILAYHGLLPGWDHCC